MISPACNHVVVIGVYASAYRQWAILNSWAPA